MSDSKIIDVFLFIRVLILRGRFDFELAVAACNWISLVSHRTFSPARSTVFTFINLCIHAVLAVRTFMTSARDRRKVASRELVDAPARKWQALGHSRLPSSFLRHCAGHDRRRMREVLSARGTELSTPRAPPAIVKRHARRRQRGRAPARGAP